MNFRTELAIPKASWSFGLGDPVLTLGSCFATSMGERLVNSKLPCLVNPFGTTYHPFAIHKHLEGLANTKPLSTEGFVQRDGSWYHYDFHSSLFGSSREELSSVIHKRFADARELLRKANVLIITYGTAWVYELAESHSPVSNCHKMPSRLFTKRLASLDEIIVDFRRALGLIQPLNPGLRIILTVSPVRHTRDTIPLNQVSKSLLRLACHQLQQTENNVDYFPAYELMMDDLRDYRFYEDDLIHPTPFAEDYIWQKFIGTYLHPATIEFLAQWEPLQKALAHRLLQPPGATHREFLTSTLRQLRQLQHIADVEKEIQSLQQQLLMTNT